MSNNNLTLEMLDIPDFEPEEMHMLVICDRMIKKSLVNVNYFLLLAEAFHFGLEFNFNKIKIKLLS